MKAILIALIAGLAALTSAVELVLHRHESRRLFVELQSLRDARQTLDQEWGRLFLEQATWATHVRIERVARETLHMVAPDPARSFELR